MKTEILNLLKNYGLFEIVPITITSYSIGSLLGGTILYLFVKATIHMAKVSHNANTIKELKKENKDLTSVKIGDMHVKFSKPRNKSKSKLKKAA
ncbi:MAG TPA: hypothetical protein VKG26_06955 [Bacteroidia bacterium]|nr:hypothetical protein [Bacteroidia bacterium]